jgi:hypothetical protein
LEGVDADGWPHFKQLKHIEPMPLKEQENFLKDHVPSLLSKQWIDLI